MKSIKQYMRLIGLWVVLLITSACSQTTSSTPTLLPTATPHITQTRAIQTTSPIATLTPPVAPSITPVIDVVASDQVDALASQTAEGYYQIGSLDAAITMVDYSDFF